MPHMPPREIQQCRTRRGRWPPQHYSQLGAGLTFIDLFAGLGGFHQALTEMGAECVFASELDKDLAELYDRNFGIRPHGDIRDVDISSIPEHDILCAGFPCQPFSMAGSQRGLECPQWGDLFGYVTKILRRKSPRFFIIENVPNLIGHDNGETWRRICRRLRDAGYRIQHECLSPHMFGIPQKRVRAFIVGVRSDSGDLESFMWPECSDPHETLFTDLLDTNPPGAVQLSTDHQAYLEAWQKIVSTFPRDVDLPSFPIWAMEFGANYPVEGHSPHKRKFRGLGRYRGAFGVKLKGLRADRVEQRLPGYACTRQAYFPTWKIDFILKNREFYAEHRKLLDPLIKEIRFFPPSFQKLEWQVKGGVRDIWKHVIQFRPSGIRVKRTSTAPSLITMTSQVPIIAWERRYMTPEECGRLQSMDGLKLPHTRNSAYKALGNAVNVEVVGRVFAALLEGQESYSRAEKKAA